MVEHGEEVQGDSSGYMCGETMKSSGREDRHQDLNKITYTVEKQENDQIFPLLKIVQPSPPPLQSFGFGAALDDSTSSI